MALICLAADKGSPGVTTSCLALAGAWPRDVIVAEVDPAGGDLVFRTRTSSGTSLDPARGVSSLAVASRHDLDSAVFAEHVQHLNGGIPVLVGPVAPAQAAALTQLWGPLGRVLGQLQHTDVLADCGRLSDDSALYPLFATARLLVLVVRAEAGQISHVRDRIATLLAALPTQDRPPLSLLVLADGAGHGIAADVDALMAGWQIPAHVVGTLPLDYRTADQINGWATGVPRRGAPLRAGAALLARDLARLVATPASATSVHPLPRQETRA